MCMGVLASLHSVLISADLWDWPSALSRMLFLLFAPPSLSTYSVEHLGSAHTKPTTGWMMCSKYLKSKAECDK